MGKFTPKEKVLLRRTNKYNNIIGGEMLDWYLDHDLRLEDITIKDELVYDKSD